MSDVVSAEPRIALARPLYSQVRELMLERINRGDWSIGDTLPNEFQLSTEFKVSIGTIRRAIEGLEEAGLVVRKQGRGTYLAGNRREAITEKFCALRTSNGERPTLNFQLEQIKRRRATSVEADRLQIKSGTEVYEVEQILLTGAHPIGIERALLEAARFPSLEKQLQYGQDLYLLYSEYGTIMTRATDSTSVVAPPPEIVSRLGPSGGRLYFAVERLSFSLDERPVEAKTSWYLPDHIQYVSEIN